MTRCGDHYRVIPPILYTRVDHMAKIYLASYCAGHAIVVYWMLMFFTEPKINCQLFDFLSK